MDRSLNKNKLIQKYSLSTYYVQVPLLHTDRLDSLESNENTQACKYVVIKCNKKLSNARENNRRGEVAWEPTLYSMV